MGNGLDTETNLREFRRSVMWLCKEDSKNSLSKEIGRAFDEIFLLGRAGPGE